MPITKSAEKAHRQSLKKKSRNKHFLALYRESLKTFEKALASGSSELGEFLADLQSKVDTLVKKNVLHKNTAARRKSAFAKQLAKLGSAITAAPAKKAAPKVAPAKKVAAPKAKKTEAKAEAPAKKTPAKKATPKTAK